jgi:hypothetical protein
MVGDRRVEQRLDEVHLSVVGRLNLDGHRDALAFGEDHELGALASAGRRNAIAPSFAEANVPSAKPSSQFSWPAWSSLASNRRWARSSVPSVVHSTKRRQQVGYDGNRGGRSFQRAPGRSTHRIPSKQARESTRGRLPFGLRLRGLNGSLMSAQCSSLSCGRKELESGSILDPASPRDRSLMQGSSLRSLTAQASRRLS